MWLKSLLVCICCFQFLSGILVFIFLTIKFIDMFFIHLPPPHPIHTLSHTHTHPHTHTHSQSFKPLYFLKRGLSKQFYIPMAQMKNFII